MAMGPLAISGGDRDPNLRALLEAARHRGAEVLDLRFGRERHPRVQWSLADGLLRVDGQDVSPHGLFLRPDVFEAMDDPRPATAQRGWGWHQALHGWGLASPRVAMVNRFQSLIASNKPAALVFAGAVGLRTPRTVVSSDRRLIVEQEGVRRIAKPVMGGGYCCDLEQAMGQAAARADALPMPALVQHRLSSPEVRVYVIGDQAIAFELQSDSLDYREKQDVEIRPIAPPPVVPALRLLMERLGMDFGAADFKTDPESGELVFLELNTSPMFARFDSCSGGLICKALLRLLLPSMPG